MKPNILGTKMVVCPACQGPSVYAPGNLSRPFCSDRCKNTDFGAWASESFRLPVDTSPDEALEGSLRLPSIAVSLEAGR